MKCLLELGRDRRGESQGATQAAGEEEDRRTDPVTARTGKGKKENPALQTTTTATLPSPLSIKPLSSAQRSFRAGEEGNLSRPAEMGNFKSCLRCAISYFVVSWSHSKKVLSQGSCQLRKIFTSSIEVLLFNFNVRKKALSKRTKDGWAQSSVSLRPSWHTVRSLCCGLGRRDRKKTFSSKKRKKLSGSIFFHFPILLETTAEEKRWDWVVRHSFEFLGNWFRGDEYSPGIEGVCKRGGSSLSFCFHPPIHSHSTCYLPLIVVLVFTRHLADSIYPCLPLHSSSLMFASCKEDILWPSFSLPIWPKETKRFLASPLKCAVYPQNDFGWRMGASSSCAATITRENARKRQRLTWEWGNSRCAHVNSPPRREKRKILVASTLNFLIAVSHTHPPPQPQPPPQTFFSPLLLFASSSPTTQSQNKPAFFLLLPLSFLIQKLPPYRVTEKCDTLFLHFLGGRHFLDGGDKINFSLLFYSSLSSFN